tara:strand:+ start:68 stop:613 length:546 start_codon:yes stop_codon:yes gene_type:complete
MPFTTNTTQGTTAYTTGTFFDHGIILENDASTLSSATPAVESAFNIAVGGYERVIGDAIIWYDTDATNDFAIQLRNVDSSDAQISSTLHYAVQGVIKGDALSSEEAVAAASLSIASTTTTGTGTNLLIRSDVDQDQFLRVNFSLISNAATKGTLQFLFANGNGTAAGTHLLAGSYVTYKKY